VRAGEVPELVSEHNLEREEPLDAAPPSRPMAISSRFQLFSSSRMALAGS
jgi:hypothetical protein